MISKELPPAVNEVTAEQVARAFTAACFSARLDPNHNLIAMLLAHSALETGHWSLLRCFNFGNVKATDGWIASGGSYTFYKASENLSPKQAKYWLKQAKPRTDGKPGLDTVKVGEGERDDGSPYWRLFFYPSSLQARFRAFPSLAQGAEQYLSKLQGRYKAALQPAREGKPYVYVDSIFAEGYFTARKSDYSKIVSGLFHNQYKELALGLGDLVELFGR